MFNADITPFLTYARAEYLYSSNESAHYFTPATVFAISSYPNQSLKFQILADDKVMMNNIPICALANSKDAPRITEEECVYYVCPNEYVVMNKYEYLAALGECGVWKKDNAFWQKGMYMFSVEWPNTKIVLHLIELEDGNYILWPNEKLTWAETEELPKF